MAAPGGGFAFAAHKRSAEDAMLDSLAPMGALQAEVLAAAAGLDAGEHKRADDEMEQESLALVLQAAEHQRQQQARGASGKAPSKTAGPLVAPLDTLIPVPEVDRRVFDSWEDFHSFLLDYGRRTHQVSVNVCVVRRRVELTEKHPLVAVQRALGHAGVEAQPPAGQEAPRADQPAHPRQLPPLRQDHHLHARRQAASPKHRRASEPPPPRHPVPRAGTNCCHNLFTGSGLAHVNW